jgi:hypothetical protein
MPDEPLSQAERDIAAVAAALPAGDPLLVDLANFADVGAPAAVALLLNGMIVFGALSSIRPMAEEVDAHFAKVSEAGLAAMESPSEEERRNLGQLATLSTSKVELFDRWREQTKADAEPYLGDDGFAFDKAPAELSRRMILLETKHYLTLTDVQILAPGQPAATHVPVMRVAVADVTGWWIVPVDENDNASLQLWTGIRQER